VLDDIEREAKALEAVIATLFSSPAEQTVSEGRATGKRSPAMSG
jgi:hypothetical protein